MEVDTPGVSIVILNWNGWKDTLECLESLFRISYPNYDTDSKDDSVTEIKKYAEGNLAVSSKFFEFSNENKPIEILEYTKEGSEEGSQPAEAFAALPSNKKMILIKADKNYGFAEGNNIGIRLAKGQYIALLNSDTKVDSTRSVPSPE